MNLDCVAHTNCTRVNEGYVGKVPAQQQRSSSISKAASRILGTNNHLRYSPNKDEKQQALTIYESSNCLSIPSHYNPRQALPRNAL